MTYSLQQLSDFEDIRTLKHRYFRGIDTADAALLMGLFTDDVSIDYRGGGYRVTIKGRDKLLDFLANSFSEAAVAIMPHAGDQLDRRAHGRGALVSGRYLHLAGNSHPYERHCTIPRVRYVRQESGWNIPHSEYDRVIELVQPLRDDITILSHYLAKAGRRLADRTDISDVIQWITVR